MSRTPIASIVTTQTDGRNLSHTGWVLIAEAVENQVAVDLAVAAVGAVAQVVTGSRP